MKSIKKLIYWIVVVDFFLIALSLSKSINWLISSQTAFVSSFIVTFASFYAYKRMINTKIASGDIPPEDRDELDIIDDEHELYEEDEMEIDLKSVIKEERARLGGIKSSAQNVVKTFAALVSPLRLGAYLFLIFSFLYINHHGYLEIWGYVSGLIIVPLVAFVVQTTQIKAEA